MMIIAVILFTFLKLIKCGHIYTWDMEFDYNNAGYMREMIISFSLENGIS